MTDMELLAQIGYHIVWIDLEHGAISIVEAIRLCRMIESLGMIPLVRIAELGRSHVQHVLDGGFHIVILPQVSDAKQAELFVELGMYPPTGQRGVSSCSGNNSYSLGDNPLETLRKANQATHLMVQFENDQGLDNLDSILSVEGIDMVTAGPLDWGISLGLAGKEVGPRVEKVLKAAKKAGKAYLQPTG